MFRPRSRAALAAAGAAAALAAAAAPLAAQRAAAPTPRSHLGFDVGADRQLADWPQITSYFTKLATASRAVRVDTLGRTTEGRPFVLVTVSSPANMRNLEAIRRAQARLADPRTLTADDERRLVATQPSVILISCNIHSSEIASSQMAMELAYRLATNDTLQKALERTVVLLVPSMNPDGEQMVTQWYRQNLGTKWEGGAMPWLYHKYVGHDNNRDWYMVTQRETQLVTDLLYRRWFPVVFYDVHQQGSFGMRLTVPPHVDPIDPNVDPLIVRGISLVGATMSQALEERGKAGVGDGATYDLWWNGGARSTPTRHNMIGLLTEAASARIATPIEIDSARLRGHAVGLPRYQQRVNFPNPWPGGTWRLRDIVDYELIAAEALVKLAADRREEFVRNFARLGRKQVELGRTQGPRAYVIPAEQLDPSAAARLVGVLRAGGVEVRRARAPFAADRARYGANSYVVEMAQPYRAHAKDLLEVQRFPRIEAYPGGPAQRPYDVAGWTLPLQMGVRVVAVDSLDAPTGTLAGPMEIFDGNSALCPSPRRRGGVVELYPQQTSCYREVARALKGGQRVRLATSAGGEAGTVLERMPRVALYKPWTGNIDEGWTRWVLEQFDLPYVTLTDSMVRAGGLRDHFDVVLVPDMNLREARDGQSADSVPPRYAGGLGTAGLGELRRFVEGGGTLVLLDRASEIATSALDVPVTRITVPPRRDDEPEESRGAAADSARRAAGEALYAPGSILRVMIDRSHPVAAGMPDTAAVYFTNSVSFEVPPGSAARVIARYPERGEDILLSGFLQGAARIAGKAAAVDAPLGAGHVVMFGFRPQYRGQSYGTFRMLFNALLTGGASPAPRPRPRR
ncbi:MAG: M14 metallopeptidase family protein [Gemmatimonadaceae bacterium]